MQPGQTPEQLTSQKNRLEIKTFPYLPATKYVYPGYEIRISFH